jgi:flagellar biosynthesis anti-sigma factor FlgM
MSVRWPVSQKTVFDEGRVDAIRQAISEGRYHVDPERLAQKILDL